MRGTRAPTAARQLRSLLKVGARRWRNRLSHALTRGWRAHVRGRRAPTGRKAGGGGALSFVLLLLLVPQTFLISFQLLGRIADGARGETQEGQGGEIRGSYPDFARQGKEELSRESQRLPSARDIERVFSDPSSRARAVKATGLFLAVLWLALLLMGLGAANQDLGSVGWSLEWLYTLPVPARALFLSKALEAGFLGVFGWMMILPFCGVYYFVTSPRAWAFLLAPLTSVYLLLLLGSGRVLIETWLRKRYSLARLKNLQALLSLAGTLLWFGCFAAAYSPAITRQLAVLADTALAPACWSPLSVPVLISGGGRAAWGAGAIMTLSAVILPWAALGLCGKLVEDGLIRSGGSAYLARRALPVPTTAGVGLEAAAGTGPARSRWLRGIVSKELKLLVRDRSFLVQSLVVPVLILGFQVVVNPRLLEGALDQPEHAAAIAFGVGAYVLAFSALQSLASEGAALWILYTFPGGLTRILARKAALWWAISAAYTLGVLLWAGVEGGDRRLLLLGPVALLGLVIYAFIAVALGALGTDPLETSPQRRVRPLVAQGYLVLAAMFGYALYAPGLWGKLAQLVISASLAGALWQKVRERIPYLLDPIGAPPPRVALSDALVVVLFFFVVQGISTMIGVAAAGELSGRVLAVAFLVAGTTCAGGSLLVFHRRKVPRLLETVGLRAEGASENLSAAVGAAAGVASAGVAWGYLRVVEAVEPLRSLKETALPLLSLRDRGTTVWVGVLGVVLAPLFEEYIFRGLVYGALRRSVRPWLAAVASAALFAVVHPALSALPVFVLGIACALVYERTRLLWGAVATHAVYNALVFTLQ